MSMNQSTKALATLAFAGLTAGLGGCGGSATPAAAAEAPASDKNGCKGESGEKHGCSAEMKKGSMPQDPAVPAPTQAAPAAPEKEMPMK